MATLKLARVAGRERQERALRGAILAALGRVFESYTRVPCPDCGHRGVGFVNPFTGAGGWACGACSLFVGDLRLGGEA